VAETGVGPFHWAHEPSLEGPGFDVAAARALLDEAGWTDRDGDGVRENADGIPLRIEVITNANTEREGIGRILRDQLAEVGVAIELGVLDVGTLQERAFTPGAREFGGIILGWNQDFNINERSFFHSESDADPYGFSALADPELDRLLDALPVTFDRDEAGPLWRRYQERIVELQPFTYLYFSQRMSGVRSSLRGVELDVRGELTTAPRWYWEPESP
jgi:peptide/nickel transport system substrate-binding protein